MQDINHPFDTGSELAITPAESLTQPPQSAPHRRWPVAIIASGLLHGAAAAAFLLAPPGTFDAMDAIQAEGTDQSGANVTGSALDDQSSGAVDVTLVPDPQPVKRQATQPAPPVEAQQPPNEPPTPQLPPQAVKEATSAPDILTATSPRQDDQSVPADSKPAPATEPQSAETPPAEPQPPPVPSATSSAPAASAGPSQTIETGGTADGDTRDAPVVASKGKQQAAGNALESRYSGEIQKKLARANRRVSKSVQAKARNNARVVFVVAADGSISDLQLAESSGSAELDQFALTLVRKQAPFPPIPPETGKSSWVFKARIGPF
ncbi:energy transducer TonB [Mesorhizobium sp. M1B.F.Ca.ET.045.04.1.1]|uniref:energy transducer TonB family protein n=1 Tax=Mesorhizobium sp. M1B.F.Ca.ET.045.04.1.1 TaxID=2493673 RepID=UPI000F755BFA|nr:energy transducer TonB [Mesorhizobium sp. M1B.F.Ca.ET.045.04.1.1]AZO29734.1 TonB family protein [Mesorhizobium sp. M1B.F.Ca.ET.045.04.1.1]